MCRYAGRYSSHSDCLFGHSFITYHWHAYLDFAYVLIEYLNMMYELCDMTL